MHKSDFTDETLLNKFLDGDISAFEEIVARYQKPVINFIYRMIGDFHEAEDLAQNVFIKLYKRADTFKGSSRLSTWLFSIAVNLCIDKKRVESRREFVSLDDEVIEIQSDSISPDTRAENSEIAQFIEEAILSLDEEKRAAIVMREYHSMSYEKIARSLGCSVGSVKSRLHKARKQLRSKLAFLLD